MSIVDPILPAVTHLMGDGAHDALAAAVGAAGGQLHSVRALQVQYEPERELVVHYRAEVTWADGRHSDDTLLAATSIGGVFPDAVPVVAETPEGNLAVSVWRYPFDPLVTGLADAVTPSLVERFVSPVVAPPLELTVLAYRPTQRAVVRVVGGDGRTVYVKAVRPESLEGLVRRHEELRAMGLPVPLVLEADAERGIAVLAELEGTTLRERIKADIGGWPEPAVVRDLAKRLALASGEGLPAVPSRVRDAIGHAALLARVVPDTAGQLTELVSVFEGALPAVLERSGAVIHGDLHEGQLIVDEEGTIVGLLDIDDLGRGDPLGDPATLTAHIRFRGLTSEVGGERIRAYSDELRRGFAEEFDAQALDVVIAAVLIGLATGPFRIQQAEWASVTRRIIADACSVLGRCSEP